MTIHPDDDLIIKDTHQDVMATYALQLDNGCFYVGRTTNLTQRLAQHLKIGHGKSALWVDKHGFKAVDYICIGQDIERDLTLAYMQKYGWEKVRGANWRSIEMLRPPMHFEELCASLPFTFDTLPMKGGSYQESLEQAS